MIGNCVLTTISTTDHAEPLQLQFYRGQTLNEWSIYDAISIHFRNRMTVLVKNGHPSNLKTVFGKYDVVRGDEAINSSDPQWFATIKRQAQKLHNEGVHYETNN